jgi:hypothetical protein
MFYMGLLNKIIIRAFSDATESTLGIPFGTYIGMFNPEKFSVANTIRYNQTKAQGSTGDRLTFNRIEPRTFNFDFLVDGTGATGEKREVVLDVLAFKTTCGFIGEKHRPSYLVLHWGSFLARCVLTSLTVEYTLFRPDGSPLRAIMKAGFKEYIVPELEELQKFLSSPDVTHVRTVAADDRLDLMSYKIFKDSKYYMELAKVNNLNHFRKLKLGEKIVFPPIEKTK